MKCYSCGNRLNELAYCPTCGADVRIYKKIIHISNAFYNEGLKKAQVRDLSGAVSSLRLSLSYYKRNIDARNLLGLVYFEMGEAVLALSEWIISKNFESKKNIADEYINRLQSNRTHLETINQTLRKYNQALQYCYQDTRDLAVIQLKKVLAVNQNLISGYQLLALLYIDEKDYSKARRILLKSLSIDINNTLSRYYLKQVNEALKEIAEHSSDKKKRQAAMETISYQSGNDTIIRPALPRERVGMSSIINIVVGVLIGVAICWFLILPARLDKEISGYDEQYKQVSEELAAEKAGTQELSKSIAGYVEENEALKAQVDRLTGASGQLTENDYLEQAAEIYIRNPEATADVMDSLVNISPEYLQDASEPFFSLYQELNQRSSETAIADYMDKARSAIRQNDYAAAIEAYASAWELDKSNSDSLINLAHAYRQSGDTKKADELYRQVIADFPDSQNAKDAADYITSD
ncbi:MAG: tetratricopeptide repeat protein [Lachnospiraceae bacterium]|nr:tetratricopeptide repeat protein [Lachnospiraceae bacterium]